VTYFGLLETDQKFCQKILLLPQTDKNHHHQKVPHKKNKRFLKKGEIAFSRFVSYLGLLETDEKYRQKF